MKLNLDRKCKYVLACSYGPDSMALFHMLKEQGYDFVVAHVNYGLRKESSKETFSLLKYCSLNNIRCYIKYARAKNLKGNTEKNCRDIRYSFFDKVCKFENTNKVLTAHNQDDLFETYLMQKRRNSLPKTYGISEQSNFNHFILIRPLLNFSKNDLLAYVQKNEVPFCIDKSNFDLTYTRNELRHNIVKNMTYEDRQCMLKDIENLNNKITKFNNVIDDIDCSKIDDLLNLEDECFVIALNRMASQINAEFSVSKRCSNEIRKILISDKPNVIYPLAKNIQFVKTYESCYFEVAKTVEYCFILEKPGKLDTPFFYLDFTNDSSNRNVTQKDYPLTIRNAHKDDLVSIKDYQVKVSRLFLDYKMPLYLRKKWPIIINNQGKVIYFPRYQSNFEVSSELNFYVK